MSSSVITLIQTQKLSGTSNSITFSNIPQSFTSLKLIGTARVNATPNSYSTRAFVRLDLGDGKRMYGSHQETTNKEKNTNNGGSPDNAINNGIIGLAPTPVCATNSFSSIHCDILNYTNKKAAYFTRSTNHASYSTTYQIHDGNFFGGGIILGDAPLNTMVIKPQVPYDFIANTQFWLYGIK